MKTTIPVIAAFLLLAPFSHAAEPEELSQTYFKMLSQQQWDEIATLYDPASLKEFREMMAFLTEVPDEAAPAVLGGFFGQGATKETVQALSDQAFFSHFLRGVMAQASRQGELNFKKVEVLGSIAEGDLLKHVVVRTHIGVGEMNLEGMEVISYRKMGERWGLLMQGKIKGLAQRIQKALKDRQQ